jgi:hypothetical protein
LPSQTDHSDSPSPGQPKTQTALEMNPLVNPLLAENMGRWAEVYFKSPPESREQAVRELLQQLEAENAQRGNASTSPRWTNEQGLTNDEDSRSEAFVPSLENRPLQSKPSAGLSATEHNFAERSLDEHSLEDPFEKSRPTENQPATIHCRSCGHENRAGQRFCGMCGLPLQREIVAKQVEEEIEASRPAERNSSFRHGEKFERALSATPKFWGARESENDDSVSAGLIRSLDYGTGGRSASLYTGAVIVVVVLALAYVGWRSSRATGYSSYATQPAPAATGQSMQQTSAPIPPKVDAVEQSANDKVAGVEAASDAKPVPKQNIATPNNERPNVERVSATGSATKPSITATSPAAEPQVPATGGSGYEELAMAKRYLNGNAGQQNNAEAVDWLWKAVAKRNTDATLLLSEMFMRGDGIPKNCDQARVLLDAAASRGVKDAGIRLRNMQAFGCQ